MVGGCGAASRRSACSADTLRVVDDRGAVNPDLPARILIRGEELECVGRHATGAYPEECCGILVGRSEGGVTLIGRVIAAMNEVADRRTDRYAIRPEDLLAAQKAARAEGLEIVGYYHSHPEHPARPSRFDLETAWPAVSYLIVSVEGGRVAETRSWRLAEDGREFLEEAVEVRGMRCAQDDNPDGPRRFSRHAWELAR